jgi:integrase
LEGFVFHLQAQGLAKPTIKNYTQAVKQWHAYCIEGGLTPLSATTQDLTAWLGYLAVDHAPSTVRLYTLAMRVYYDYLKAAKLKKGANPARAIAVRKQVAKPVGLLEPFEIKAMLGVCESLQDRAMILLLVGGGLRRSELLGIKREDIDFEHGLIRIWGKGGKWRNVAPGKLAMEATKLALGWRERVFDNQNADSVRMHLNRLVAKAGITRHVHPHMLRYYFAVNFCENGGGIDLLQTILGHTSLEMSMHYSRQGRERRAMAAQLQFNPADRLTS